MRIVICGDTHIGAVFGLGNSMPDGINTRVRDYEKSLNHIIDYCISEKVDVFVQTGDVFESRNPLPEHMQIVDFAVKRLSNAGISTMIMMGNHDYRRNGKEFSSSISLLASKDYANVRIVLSPEVIEINNSNDCVNILLVPYRDKRMYGGNSCREASGGYNKHIESLIGDVKNSNPIVAIGHNFYFEGSYNDFGGSEILADINSFSSCELVAMGHQHNFRIVRKKNPIAIYTGSMERINFGDALVDKYFIDYDSINKKINIKRTPVRDLCDSEINLVGVQVSDMDKRVDEALTGMDVDGKIARARVMVNESTLSSISKSYIENKMYSMGAFYVSKIVVEPVSEKIVRDLSVLNHQDSYLMFEAFVKSQKIDDDIKIKILKHAKDIIG